MIGRLTAALQQYFTLWYCVSLFEKLKRPVTLPLPKKMAVKFASQRHQAALN